MSNRQKTVSPYCSGPTWSRSCGVTCSIQRLLGFMQSYLQQKFLLLIQDLVHCNIAALLSWPIQCSDMQAHAVCLENAAICSKYYCTKCQVCHSVKLLIKFHLVPSSNNCQTLFLYPFEQAPPFAAFVYYILCSRSAAE